MPHAWPFSAPFAAWRRSSSKTDGPPLLRDAAAAFVDRAPIDWTALLVRLPRGRDRALVENLHALDDVRRAASASRQGEWPAAPAALARLVIGLAVVQIASGVLVIAAAAASGQATDVRGVPAVVAASYIASAGALAATASRDPRRLFLLGAFLCTASAFARAALATVDPNGFPIAVLVVRGVWTEVFTPACVWLFALSFPRVVRFTPFDAAARRLTAMAWALGVAVFVLNLWVAYVSADHTRFASVLPNHPNNLFWRVFTVVDLLAVATIFIRARRAPPDERRRVWNVAKAIGICMAPFLLLGAARTAVPSIDAWLVAARPEDRRWLDALILAALAAAPILTTLAVIVDRPFDLQGIARRTWRYALARSNRGVLRDQRRLARGIDSIRLARDDRERIEHLERAVRDTLGASTVHVIVPDSDDAFRQSALFSILSAMSDPLVCSTNSRLIRLLPESDRQWLHANGIDIAAPVLGDGGTLAGVVVAGRRFPRHALDERDSWVLATLTAAAANAWHARSDIADVRAAECSACGAVPPCRCSARRETAVLPARLAHRFVVQQRIGAGAAGVVYLARDERLGRDVALKTLPYLTPDAAVHLRAEARAMAALDHGALATIYGLELWHDMPVLVVEYFPNGTLEGRLTDGPLSPARTIELGVTIARALVYMHGQGVLHRDLKPSNIGLTSAGMPKLLDFGLSALDGSAATSRFAGTPCYLPPEAYHGARADPGFDLWALGLVLLEAVTGSDRRALTKSLFSDLHFEFRDSHPDLARFFTRALAERAEDRFQTSAEFLAALERMDECSRR